MYIYCMLMNVAGIGIPLTGQSSMLLIIYLAPLGLLVLIMVLNKEMRIIDSNNIKFCITEIIMTVINVIITLVDDSIKTYVLLIVLALCAAVICA